MTVTNHNDDLNGVHTAAPASDTTNDDHKELEKAENGNATVMPADELDEVLRAEHEFTPEEYKKLLRKIDMVLMYVDKVSLSYGVVFGLKQDTHLVGLQYQNLTTFFYMAYAFAQMPMGYLLQRFPLGRALGVCFILWGAMVMFMAAAHNYPQLVGLRVLLGWFESVITPAFAILTSSWYLRKEQTLRQILYYSMNQFFILIFGISIYYLARAAERAGGLAAWRVINLFLGGVTVAVGTVFLLVVGTPSEVWWLSKREKLMAHARIVSNSTGGGEQQPWKWSQVRECLRDRAYWHAIIFNLLGNIPNGAVTTFNTLLMSSFGFSPLDTVLYGMPGAGACFVLFVATGFLVRYRSKWRFPLALTSTAIAMGIFFFEGFSPDSMSKWAKWAVFMFIPIFSLTAFLMWPLMSVNVAGRTKKSFTAASCFFCYCAGNIIGSQIFVPSDAPKYLKGLIGCAVVMAVGMVNMALWWQHYVSVNRKRDATDAASGITEEEREHANRVAGETDLTDLENKYFRYST